MFIVKLIHIKCTPSSKSYDGDMRTNRGQRIVMINCNG